MVRYSRWCGTIGNEHERQWLVEYIEKQAPEKVQALSKKYPRQGKTLGGEVFEAKKYPRQGKSVGGEVFEAMSTRGSGGLVGLRSMVA